MAIITVYAYQICCESQCGTCVTGDLCGIGRISCCTGWAVSIGNRPSDDSVCGVLITLLVDTNLCPPPVTGSWCCQSLTEVYQPDPTWSGPPCLSGILDGDREDIGGYNIKCMRNAQAPIDGPAKNGGCGCFPDTSNKTPVQIANEMCACCQCDNQGDWGGNCGGGGDGGDGDGGDGDGGDGDGGDGDGGDGDGGDGDGGDGGDGDGGDGDGGDGGEECNDKCDPRCESIYDPCALACGPCNPDCPNTRCNPNCTYDCCFCEGLGAPCCEEPDCVSLARAAGTDPCLCPDYIDPECCGGDRCSPACWAYCTQFPNLAWCAPGNSCELCPCHPSCPDRFCDPRCPEFDPCLTSCPGFSYCITGQAVWTEYPRSAVSVEQWNAAINDRRSLNCPQYGPCYEGPFPEGHTGCFDPCTAIECSGYNPCHPSCSPDYCNPPCLDPCKCDNPCDPGCSGFTACAPECNPNYCDPDGECYRPCDPGCTPNPCDPICPGYGPCHPDCPEVPCDITRRPCNPLCPGFDPCNRDCPNYDEALCCQGCNCSHCGTIITNAGNPAFNPIEIDRWVRNNPRPNPNDNLCNNDIATCLVGAYDYSNEASFGVLMRYNENSEFRKITMRSFFNMPTGEAFDCREEKITGVALPQIVIEKPTSGQVIEETNTNRPITIRYRLTNPENLGYYKIRQINVYIDNRLRSTISVNMLEFGLTRILDGRRTLKMEMIDTDGNLVSGTQSIVLFGYRLNVNK